MGPELIIIAVAGYGAVFAVVGLLIGIFVKGPAVLAATIVSMATVIGAVNGYFAPSGFKLEAGVVAFLFVAVVSGFIATIVAVARGFNSRSRNERTAV